MDLEVIKTSHNYSHIQFLNADLPDTFFTGNLIPKFEKGLLGMAVG
jgi:hypothetical protein